jgi:hypothetical protein
MFEHDINARASRPLVPRRPQLPLGPEPPRPRPVLDLGHVQDAEPLDPWVLAGGSIIAAGVWFNLRGELQRRG